MATDDFFDFLDLAGYAGLTAAISAALGIPVFQLTGRRFVYSVSTGQVSLVDGGGYTPALKLPCGLTPDMLKQSAGGPQKSAGDSWDFPVTVTDAQCNPIDISNGELWFTLKQANEQSAPVTMQYHTAVVPDANTPNGHGTLRVPSSNTASIVPGLYWFYLQYADATQSPAFIKTVLSQQLIVLPSGAITP